MKVTRYFRHPTFLASIGPKNQQAFDLMSSAAPAVKTPEASKHKKYVGERHLDFAGRPLDLTPRPLMELKVKSNNYNYILSASWTFFPCHIPTGWITDEV